MIIQVRVFVIFIWLILLSNGTQVPKYLLECYRNNVSTQLRNIQVPMSSRLLVELVRNVEVNLETILDMRTMGSSMLHSLKFDGIQRATDVQETVEMIPVGPTSMHFSLYKLLKDYLLPGDAALFPIKTLTIEERCTLHYMISSSVQAWVRGEESETCPEKKSLNIDRLRMPMKILKHKKSFCPIERGVMRTLWGDVAPGKLLTGIVASVSQQNVKLKRIFEAFSQYGDISMLNTKNRSKIDVDGEINNVWAATIAGDLAEVVVNQGQFLEKFIIGPSGFWNDTIVPRIYYLPNSIGEHWEMTSAELLGGIDGALLADKIMEWTTKMSTLRMSQILDMYYSRKGIAFDTNYRACQRRENFAKLLKTVDLAAQTAGVAKLLTHHHIFYQNEDFLPQSNDRLEQITGNIVKIFTKHIGTLRDLNNDCEKGYETTPMSILTVLDGTWTHYQARRLITGLIHVADVSYFGSRMGFISGETGFWLTNVTNKIFEIYEDVYKGETKGSSFWPNSFSLTKGLETVENYLQIKTDEECASTLRSTMPTVILVLANTAIPNDADLHTARKLISSIKSMQPGTPVLYVASETNAFAYEELSRNIYMNDIVIKAQKTIEDTVLALFPVLKAIPKQVMEIHCGISPLEYEDYITPGLDAIYEISYHFLQTTRNIRIEFVGNDYGELTICANDKDVPENKKCQGLREHDAIEFEPLKVCQHEYACIVQLKAKIVKSKFKCAEDGCRYPDQVRIKIRTTWASSSCSKKSNIIFIVLMLFFFSTHSEVY